MASPTKAPALTNEQRRAALDKAMRIRTARHSFLSDVSHSKISVPEAMGRIDGDDIVGRTRVSAFIKAVPNFGIAKTKRVMENLGIPANRRLRGLGCRQREALTKALSNEH